MTIQVKKGGWDVSRGEILRQQQIEVSVETNSVPDVDGQKHESARRQIGSPREHQGWEVRCPRGTPPRRCP